LFRRIQLAAAISLIGGACLMPACTEQNRYRVLTFFFDGVPEPGSVPTKGYAAPEGALVDGATAEDHAGGYKVYGHTPYKEDRCADCHDILSGQLARTPEQGLCLTCHVVPAPGARYEHGPVAANDCTFCHHPHVSRYPYVLKYDPHTLCFQCHQAADLSTGQHHADLESGNCVDCHDPHGGTDRYFLKRNES
jgi:predicted CXXCH cytochrome family protein